ncbi:MULTISPECIES: hypothetical protein [Legionella]|uniref:Uncharacterized protein n=1 Tax=Legionella steelei TaxID=947033 RepID=A0A0W0ZKG5_9GAMM|nr:MULTISPECIES: hypothetical protein [Legionella]KTD69490.1 hypothetical protein Lste_2648 [Legionella steelei]MBN9228662.1 hypothetical protein [Legionella steelei]OJW08669.1 MAG: hypothetical protein BGO44_16110 [Legionella sp. 39-23]
MWKKADKLVLSPFGSTVLSNVSSSYSGRLGTIFSSTFRAREFEQTLKSTVLLPAKKAKVDLPTMLEGLPKSVPLHRGMAGLEEVESIVTHGKFGAGKYTKRPASLDIAEFIDKPKSSLLLSTSPDPHTVREYMIGFQLITAKGAIVSMGLPAVFIRPQTARHVDVELFEHYQKVINAAVELGNRTQYENIFDLAHGNNETTVILGATKQDDWRPRFDRDIHSIVLVEGAGRILSGFTNANTVEATTIENPGYSKRLMAIEVFSTASGEGAFYDKYHRTMTKRSQELGLIEGDQRILTMSDASALMSSPKYLELMEQHTTTGETMVLQSVPRGIPIGSEELIEYVAFLIESNPEKTPVIPTDTTSSARYS